MKLNYKKSLKLITLLFTSILIASVSAATYKYMFIENGQISIGIGGLQWLKGSDANVGTLISGNTVTGLALSVTNGTQFFFNNTLYLNNTDLSTQHTFSINVTSTAGETGNFDFMYLKLYDNTTNELKATLDLLTLGPSQSGLAITGGNAWRVSFDVKAKAIATTGTVTFTIKITYQ